MDNIRYKLNSNKSVNSTNKDIGVNTSINSNIKNLPFTDINEILDIGEQFNKERNESSKYRFIFTLKTLFSNVLTDIGTNENYVNTLNYFGNSIFTTDIDGNVLYNKTESISNNLKEKDGWLGYYQPEWVTGSDRGFIDLLPNRTLFDLLSGNNWDICITYPESIDESHFLVNGGLFIVDKREVILGGKNLTLITTPIKHNLVQNDVISINDVEYNVLRLGEDNGDLKEYSFVVNSNFTDNNISVGARFNAVRGGEKSSYYIRRFKCIDLSKNYELFKLGFSKNIYGDDIGQLTINNDIDLGEYIDNLGRPLSELFFTIIKKDNNGFSEVKSGVNIPFIPNVSSYINIGDIRRIHNVLSWDEPTQIPFEVDLDISDGVFNGDIVEYNKTTVKETTLCDFAHRFNRVDRDDNGRPEGYYYKPHYKVGIRQWSNFIEQGDGNTFNIPKYAEYLDDGRYLWRDLLDIGFNDGYNETLNYPFLNGCHYIHSILDIRTYRQDPFNKYNLYYLNSPKDLYGDLLNDDNLIVKNSDNVC